MEAINLGFEESRRAKRSVQIYYFFILALNLFISHQESEKHFHFAQCNSGRKETVIQTEK